MACWCLYRFCIDNVMVFLWFPVTGAVLAESSHRTLPHKTTNITVVTNASLRGTWGLPHGPMAINDMS